MQTSYVAVIVVGLAAGYVFVRRQRALEHPLLDLALFSRPAFRTAIIMNVGAGIAMAGTFLLVSQYMQLVLGRDPLQAGLWLVPGQLVMIVASLATPKVAARFGRRNVIVGGLVIAGLGFALLTRLSAPADGGPSTPLPLVLIFAVCAMGIAAPMALVIDLVVGSVPPTRAGAAAAISETGGEFGIAFGVAAFGSIGAAVYRNGLHLPSSLPGNAAASIRESLAGAVGATSKLPGGHAILTQAQTSFTDGIGVVAVIGVAIFAVLAVAALRGFRGVDAGEPAPAPEPEPGVAADTERDLVTA